MIPDNPERQLRVRAGAIPDPVEIVQENLELDVSSVWAVARSFPDWDVASSLTSGTFPRKKLPLDQGPVRRQMTKDLRLGRPLNRVITLPLPETSMPQPEPGTSEGKARGMPVWAVGDVAWVCAVAPGIVVARIPGNRKDQCIRPGKTGHPVEF